MPNELDPSSGSSNEQTPKYLTSDEVAVVVNAALTNRFPKLLAPLLEAALKPITEKLNAPPPPPVNNDGDDGGNGKKGKQSPELLAMAAKVEQMEKALNAEKDRVIAAEKRNREERAYNELRASLEGKVKPELLDMVAKHQFQVEQRVETDDSGSILFKMAKVAYPGADPEDVRLPLRSGVEEWLKSDEAKPFIPAPSQGSGSSPMPKRASNLPIPTIDTSKPATTDAEKLRRAQDQERKVRAKLNM